MSDGYRSPRRILLGPAPCDGCGRPLTWEHDNSGRHWRDSDGAIHRCTRAMVRALQRADVGRSAGLAVQ